MARIIIPGTLEDEIKRVFDNNNEVGCYFLAEADGDALHVGLHHFISSEPNSFDAKFVAAAPEDFLARVKENPARYALLPGHMHSRKYGDRIEIFDPYFTLPNETPGHSPGDIVEGKFFVSRKPGRAGDVGAVRKWAEYFQIVHGISVPHTVFVHPAYGSEGDTIRPDLVQIAAYELDPAMRFGVRDVPIEIGR